MTSLSWNQIHAWRLERHFLSKRARRETLLDVVSRLVGVHAQVMSAAELSLWARIEDLRQQDVGNALWEKRLLAKTWAMRGTLHLLTARDFPLVVRALGNSVANFYRRGSWLKFNNLSLQELETLVTGVRDRLSDEPVTREQLASRLAEHVGQPHLRDRLLSGWGVLLKPASHAGYLAFGPNRGQNVTFVRPDLWLGEWQEVDPDEALEEVVRRYLNTYGPATTDEFGRWWGIDVSKAKRLFTRLGDDLVQVDVEGWRGWMLASSIDAIRAMPEPDVVRLLPHFDVYVVALGRQSDVLVPAGHRARIYRNQGWISPVVLVDGRMVGVWEYEKRRGKVAVTVDLFEPADDRIRAGIQAEAERLGRFLELEPVVAYA
ncbi:MAG: winged helix DNA-binding domain-containing protein [Chloroflexota bacterium]|nr:MAG: hypothetical protein DIU68_02545 [Chloroflexota bacterium]